MFFCVRKLANSVSSIYISNVWAFFKVNLSGNLFSVVYVTKECCNFLCFRFEFDHLLPVMRWILNDYFSYLYISNFKQTNSKFSQWRSVPNNLRKSASCSNYCSWYFQFEEPVPLNPLHNCFCNLGPIPHDKIQILL